jgi:aspartyl-tRNA synthetase
VGPQRERFEKRQVPASKEYVSEIKGNKYRTHKNDELRPEQVGQHVRVSGWVHRKRDHGNLLFIDLRDHYGVTQVVFTPDSDAFTSAEAIKLESVISVSGKVIARTEENINPSLPTGRIEVVAERLDVLSAADVLPFQVAGTQDIPEEQRLRYRFLDLRRDKIHGNVVLRSKVISSIRRRMVEQGFLEYQTPILTSSSPEGARDYLVPSRIHAGRFYALPQAPQQFKQLLMVSGFDRYFQVASATRTHGPIARRASSISSISKCRSSSRTMCLRRLSRCCRDCFRSFRTGR